MCLSKKELIQTEFFNKNVKDHLKAIRVVISSLQPASADHYSEYTCSKPLCAHARALCLDTKKGHVALDSLVPCIEMHVHIQAHVVSAILFTINYCREKWGKSTRTDKIKSNLFSVPDTGSTWVLPIKVQVVPTIRNGAHIFAQAPKKALFRPVPMLKNWSQAQSDQKAIRMRDFVLFTTSYFPCGVDFFKDEQQSWVMVTYKKGFLKRFCW